jgi:hypothetical protein
MERRELEATAARGTYLRGLLALPLGLLFMVTGVGNLGWTPLQDPLVFLTCLLVLAALAYAISRSYDVHYGRVRLLKSQQVRFTVASAACFGIPMILGTILDFRLDLPISVFDVLFGAGMLIWFYQCVGLRPDHLIVWGALIVVGLVPLWGGFDDRASVGWLPIGVATIVAGLLDHLALARNFGPTTELHVGT